MLKIQSKTDKDKSYLFESLSAITSKDLAASIFSGIYVNGIPSKLESTLELNSPNPLEKNIGVLTAIINDCELPEISAAYNAKSFIGVYDYLTEINGVVRLPYRIHTLRKI